MNLTPNTIGIGLLAGFASALLAMGIVSGSGLAIILYLLSPLPIIAASAGWGLGAGILAAVAAVTGVSIIAAPASGFVIAAFNTVPGLVAAWLGQLARPAEEVGGPKGQLAWYPLPSLLFRVALAVSIGAVAAGILFGYSGEFGTMLAREFAAQLKSARPDLVLSDEFEPGLAAFLTGAVPIIQTAMGFGVVVLSFYLGMALVRRSRPGIRPADDWPATLRMPKPALAVLAGAMAASLVPGPVSHIAGAFIGPLGMGFTMAGLAVLHQRSRGKTWRAAALTASYLAVFLFAPAIFFFTVIGMFDTTRSSSVASGRAPDNDNPND